MTNVFKKCFSELPSGMKLFLLIYLLSCPVFLIAGAVLPNATPALWVTLSPALVWKGQLWRLVSYALLATSIPYWLINAFWLFTLVPVMARDWSSKKLWLFCLSIAFIGALLIILIWPSATFHLLSPGAIIFGLLVAWARLYGRERIILLGLGEVSVRQAAIFIGVINAVITFFSCGGLLLTLSLMCGALGGWLYLAVGKKRLLSRNSQPVESERIARLEL